LCLQASKLHFPYYHHYSLILHSLVTEWLMRSVTLLDQAQYSAYLALHFSEDDKGLMHWVLCVQEMALMEVAEDAAESADTNTTDLEDARNASQDAALPGQDVPPLITDWPIAVAMSRGSSSYCSAAESFAQELVKTPPLTPMLHCTVTEDNIWPIIDIVENIAEPDCQSSGQLSVALTERQMHLLEMLSSHQQPPWISSQMSTPA